MPARQRSTADDAGDRALMELTELLNAVAEARASVGRARVRAKQMVPQARHLLVYVRGLPVLDLDLSNSWAGHTIASSLSRRIGLVPATTAVAVLELPGRPADYLVGRSRQAVRTGVNQARREGLSVVRVTDDEERRARALELAEGKVTPDYGATLRTWAVAPTDESWFVVDADGHTLACAILAVDGWVARLGALITGNGDGKSSARYLLSAHVFADLIACGVSHVIAEGALFLPPGLLHFQRLLGFRPMNVTLRRRDGGSIEELVALGSDRPARSARPARRSARVG
jgi:hypothetical protein